MNGQIRKMNPSEYTMLSDFLYEAIFLPDGVEAPPRSILQQPELQLYIDHFGEKPDDHALVVEVEHQVVGAVWVRIMKDYGHVDDQTPSFAISLYEAYRGKGLGTVLMKEMLSLLQEKGYVKASLSVQKENKACNLYQSLGFQIVDESEEEYRMVYYLTY